MEESERDVREKKKVRWYVESAFLQEVHPSHYSH